jgi:hypothetical protein
VSTIEIIVKGDIEMPKVIRFGGQPVQIHINIDMNLDFLQNQLAKDLTSQEFQIFTELWSNDQHPRVYVQGENYLKIMSKE